jgi:hypothetical protein
MSYFVHDNQPVINHLVINDCEILGLPPLKTPKTNTVKGCHSWPVLESITKDKDENGNLKLVYRYPANNWKDIMLISVHGEKAPFMQDFGQVCDAWEDMVEFLKLQCTNGEDLIYKKGILRSLEGVHCSGETIQGAGSWRYWY